MQEQQRTLYVAYSRARDLLFLLTPDSRWKPAPAVGLGGEFPWFTQYVHEWLIRETASRRKKTPPSSSEGTYNYELWS
ncbi:MAG: hypothetical protein ACYDER_22530 [Ktedonobacteraceae bacterium]